MKHAPGPWESKHLAANASSGHVILWQDRSKPGVHMRRLDSKGEFAGADARLIAAAPELLEALKDLLEAADSMRGTCSRIAGETPEHEDTYTHDKWAEEFLQERAEVARTAIAKARTK